VQFDNDPSKLQLMEGREHAALELSRVANIPPYLNGIATGGMTYQNAQQARQDLYLFGAKPFISCIEETLSLDTVTPRGRHVRFDVGSYLNDYNLAGDTEPMMETEVL
jgi:phage portal protein BeeE